MDTERFASLGHTAGWLGGGLRFLLQRQGVGERYVSLFLLLMNQAPSSSLQPIYLILLVLAAFGLALGADYFMDDYFFVVDRDGFSPARWNVSAFGVHWLDGGKEPTLGMPTISGLLPGLIFTWHQKLFGTGTVAQHVWNVVLHGGVVLAAWATFGRFLAVLAPQRSVEARQSQAFWAAALLAVHPLASESVCYAKCVYMQLVTLFMLLFCHAGLGWLQSKNRRSALQLALWAVLGHLSYPYGFPSIAAAGVVLAAVAWGGRKSTNKAFSGKTRLWVALVALCIVVWVTVNWGGVFVAAVSGEFAALPHHWLTQGRVTWLYLQRMVLPIGLCADHYLPWTTSWADWRAVLALTTFLGFYGIALWRCAFRPGAAFRWVWAAVPLLLSFQVLRLLHANAEVMVEYRTSSMLPWGCLLLAGGLCALRERWGVFLRLSIVLGFLLLSVQRCVHWFTEVGLGEQTVALYPLNNRAQLTLFKPSVNAADFPEMQRRLAAMQASHKEILRYNETHPYRKYDVWRADKSLLQAELLILTSRTQKPAPDYSPDEWQAINDRWRANPAFTQAFYNLHTFQELIQIAQRRLGPSVPPDAQ